MGVLKRIFDRVQSHPERAVWINRDKQLTYQALWEQSDALAVWVASHLGQDKAPVLVYGHKEPEMLICFLACVKAGRAYIPVDAANPLQRVERVIMGSQTSMILSPGQLPGQLAMPGLIVLQQGELQNTIRQNLGKAVQEEQWVQQEDNFYMIYTSGSTGDPKGVQITSACLSSFLDWMCSDFGLSAENGAINAPIVLNQAPLSFDLSVMDVYTSMMIGGTSWAVDKDMIENPRQLFDALRTSRLNVWVSTPSFAELCLMDPSFNEQLLPKLSTFLFCGETLSNSTAAKLIARFPNASIFNTYGPTEATVAVTAVRVTDELIKQYAPLPVGYVKSDCEIQIVDEQGEFLPEGAKGEIVIIGPSVSTGYYQNQAMSGKAFFQLGEMRAYRTGDLGYFSEGLLFYCGRADFQVKLQGYRIELEDIEQNLRKLPSVKNAVVSPNYKDGKCESLTAFVVPERYPVDNEFAAGAAIKKELVSLIPSYMIPRRVVFQENLPLSINGKINRKALTAGG